MISFLAAAALFCAAGRSGVWAQQPYSELKPVQTPLDERAEEHAPVDLRFTEGVGHAEYGTLSLCRDAEGDQHRTVDYTIAPAEFSESDVGDPVQHPSYLDPDSVGDPNQRPSYLDSDSSEWSVTGELELLDQRLKALETAQTAHEDATRTIVRQSFAERGSNITDSVVFGGTIETLTFWADDFDGVAESDIVLDTAELDFEIQVNSWTLGSLVLEYFDGSNFFFPTTEEDEGIAVDRVNVRQAWIRIGDTQNYPLFATFGRDVVPFGISTGDPVADVLTINDPLTVEVFETTEDFMMIGFVGPTCCPPPASPNPVPPPPPVKPLLFNPLVRRAATCLCSYCPCYPPIPPPVPVAPPPTCTPPFSGAIYFYNGDTSDGGGDHIEHMGGTLGYFTKGALPYRCIPWSVDVDVDVNSSVFDSNFLRFEYRGFLDQIGFVPGMAAHAKSSLGPTALVVEWNGAINDVAFTDDLDNDDVSIRPNAWQISLAYQFDWNPSVEIIGAQGTYFAIGYSESHDLPGVMLAGQRDGFVPRRRFLVTFGEWVLDGVRIAIEYSYNEDYPTGKGGTGRSANGFFSTLTYVW